MLKISLDVIVLDPAKKEKTGSAALNFFQL